MYSEIGLSNVIHITVPLVKYLLIIILAYVIIKGHLGGALLSKDIPVVLPVAFDYHIEVQYWGTEIHPITR